MTLMIVYITLIGEYKPKKNKFVYEIQASDE